MPHFDPYLKKPRNRAVWAARWGERETAVGQGLRLAGHVYVPDFASARFLRDGNEIDDQVILAETAAERSDHPGSLTVRPVQTLTGLFDVDRHRS